MLDIYYVTYALDDASLRTLSAFPTWAIWRPEFPYIVDTLAAEGAVLNERSVAYVLAELCRIEDDLLHYSDPDLRSAK